MVLAGAEIPRAQRRSRWPPCPASELCLRALRWEKQEAGFGRVRLQAETGCWRMVCFYLGGLQSCLGSAVGGTGH